MTTPVALDLPYSARLACWLRALAVDGTSPDEALAAVARDGSAHHVAGLDDTSAQPLALVLGRLRGSAREGVHVAMPVAGDPVGLAGPSGFNVEALEVGECVVLGDGRGPVVGLVPHATGAGVVWQSRPANPPPPYDPGEARRGLHSALSATADALGELDLARWSPEAADLLLDLRSSVRLDLPPGTPAETAATLGTALRCQAIVEVALDSASAAVTAGQSDRREAALRPLARASRLAMSAACSSP